MYKRCFIIYAVILIVLVGQTYGQQRSSMPVATYSIVALDEKTGQLGVAVQSHWFSVGSIVSWVRAGVGAVATQSFVKVDYGPEGLKLMADGLSAEEALNQLLAEDEGEAVRQVGMVDAHGNVSVHTGSKCIQQAGHRTGKGYTVQANLMANSTVPDAMAVAYENAEGDLAERLMAALEAAENEGGDIRGRQSAAMIIATGEPTGIHWKDVLLDLRVEDHPEPLKELKRLIRIHRAYEHANRGDLYVELDRIDEALIEYEKAADYYPENPELPYWTAVSLADIGRLDEALPIFKDVFERFPDLRILTPRLVRSGLLPDDPELINLILSQ
jgi:uncharacterized Ntn-hydrolase superfamily protein